MGCKETSTSNVCSHTHIQTFILTLNTLMQTMKYATCFNETDALIRSRRVFVKYPECPGAMTTSDTDGRLLDLGNSLFMMGLHRLHT